MPLANVIRTVSRYPEMKASSSEEVEKKARTGNFSDDISLKIVTAIDWRMPSIGSAANQSAKYLADQEECMRSRRSWLAA